MFLVLYSILVKCYRHLISKILDSTEIIGRQSKERKSSQMKFCQNIPIHAVEVVTDSLQYS